MDSKRRITIDVGIVVSDLEQALHFYRDTIGLEVKLEVQTKLIGAGRMVQLAHGNALLKLIEFEQRPLKPEKVPISGMLGVRYMTLLVPDIGRVLEKILHAGYPIEMPLSALPNGTMIAMVADADGNTVEFVQESLDT